MKIFLLLILFTGSVQSYGESEEREGSMLIDKVSGSKLYFACVSRDMERKCDQYQAFLERPFRSGTITIQPIPAPMEKILLHASLYKALLTSTDIYITGKPINLKTYNLTKAFYAKTTQAEFSVGNVIVKAIVGPITFAVGVAETIIDKPQNLAMKTKAILLKAKYKALLTRLFLGDKEKSYEIRSRRFNKLVKLIKNIE